VNREPISLALFNLLSGLSYNDGTVHTFVTASRRPKVYGDADIGEQPAFFLAAPHESDQQPDMALTEYRLHYVALVYFQAPSDLNAAPCPDTTFNAILLAMEAALGTPGGERIQNMQLIGGTPANPPVTNVVNCWIEGTIDKVGGILDQQCALIVPITVLAGI
jgi:hypothetical protein